jgi:protein TonB
MHRDTKQLSKQNDRTVEASIFFVIFLIHVWLAFNLFKTAEILKPVVPLMMEATLVTYSISKGAMVPPVTAPPVALKKLPVSPVKKVLKKSDEAHKKPKLHKPLPSDLSVPKPAISEAPTSPIVNQATQLPSPPQSSSGTQGDAVSFTKADFSAKYGSNAKPIYPMAAKRSGDEGTVLLKVEVSADGFSQSVTIHQSSGYDELDQSAVTAVEKWVYIPAKRGNDNVTSTIIVPIIYSLRKAH